MPLRHRLAGATALTLAATLPSLVQVPAHAGALGAGETVVSGTTTPAGVGESVVAALSGGRSLVVWEGVRTVATGTAQGQKREIYGRVLDAAGAATGVPVLVARMGGVDDATQDAADPAVATLPDGRVALVVAGDALADTAGAPTPTDTTSWQIQLGVVDPSALGPVTLTPLTSVAPGDPAYDQQHPDVALDHGLLRVVWDGDTPATGEGQSHVWTAQRALDLTAVSGPTQVSPSAPAGAAYDHTRPRVAATTAPGSPNAMVVWEGVGSVDAGGPLRRVQAARLTGATAGPVPTLGIGATRDSGIEELAPDVAAAANQFRVVWSTNAGSGYRINTAAVGDTGTVTQTATEISGGHDTWPSVAFDDGQPGQFVVDFARRTSTAGTGHHEVVSGRYGASADRLEPFTQLSTTDTDASYDNAESMRPATAAAASGAVLHAWSRVRQDSGAGVATRRSAALVDLSTTLSITPARPTPARAGINAADTVTVAIGYGTTAASSGRAASRLTLDFPGFTASSSTITGPAVASGGGWDVPAMAPGARGTVTLSGTMDAAAEGTLRSASAALAVATGLVVDDPSTNNTATSSVTIDHPPAVTGMTRLDATPSNDAVRWRVDLDQPVTGLAAGDFALAATGLTSPSITGVTCGVASCTVTATATGTGRLTLRVPASATATDATGKALATGNLPFDGPAYDIDTVAPTVTNTALGPDPSNAALVEFRLDFSEPVAQPQSAQLTVTGGTLSSVVRTGAGSGLADSWTARVTPAGDGAVTLTPGAGAGRDAAGNTSPAGSAASTTSDRTVPVVTLTGPTAPQRTAYDVTVDASETITGLGTGDFSVTGGAVTRLTGSGPWTVRVQPDTEGPVVLSLPAGSVTDAAGNPNAAVSSTTTYDVTRPGVVVSSAAAERTGDDPIGFTLTFTEPVTGLTAGDLAVTGGTATMSGSGATRTVLVAPAGEGPVSVAVPAGVAVDEAGNTNTAGPAVTRTYDVTGPTPQVRTSTSSPTNAASFPVTVTWPEEVTGFTVGDVAVTNGTVSGFAGAHDTWTFAVTPAADGEVRVSVPAGAAQDLGGNPSLAATRLDVVVDTAAPGVGLSSASGDPTRSASITVDVTFSEPVSGLSPDDFVRTNATIADLSGSGSTYTMTVSPLAEGVFGVRLPAGAATDAAGNASTAGSALHRTFDATATARLAYAGPALVNAPVQLTLTLSDPAPIVAGDLTTTNADVTSVAGGPRVYDVVLTPTADGRASVQLPAGAFTDAAGNTSSASAEVEVTYDATRPTVTDLAAPARASAPYAVSVELSEPVQSLSAAQVVVTNGTAGSVAGASRDWSFVVTPAADGPVTVRLLDDAARDAAGNASVASGTVSTTYDATAPTATLTSPTAAVVTTSPIPVVIAFSEAVTGLAVDDVEVTNGTLTNLVGGGTRWTADLVPADDGTVTARVVADAVTDQAGHPSLASATLTRELDSTRPTLALTSPLGGTVTASTIPVTATFSKRVLGFGESDLQTTRATVAGFTQVDDRTWHFDLVATADGRVGVSVPENAAASAGGNLAFGASLELAVDRAAPVLQVRGPASVTEDGPVTFTVTASEAVTGLDESDFSVSGSAGPGAIALTPVSAGTWQVAVSGMGTAGDVTLAVRSGAVSDAAGNTSVATSATAAWRRSGRLEAFALVQRPGSRQGNRVSLPVAVRGDAVTFEATSSNQRLLPASAISVTGSGSVRQLTLAAGHARSGTTTVVVTARAGSVVRTLTLRLVVGDAGDERLVGGRGTDVILARTGVDAMVGRGGDDHLYGGYGRDRLVGGAGDDLLVGGPGRDDLVGGSGADLFVTWGRDDLVDVRAARGDRVLRASRALQRLLGP
ncbi:hypothetical protein ASC64_11735 [Nocardioides sp. Root122]|uniref:beta strand repeat-containing protein n=1 Tax=Nocardioides TaxID=1839 RepID=UPI00070331A5|nr:MULTISPECIES: Ig-like domain-containing protein [Nocardioides]KQV67864.1 hypothetical protein ASC64_11735 [Nocardioides sp. Root122]MCK9823802.1 Ig-like domain-containing protein [Nocardioides cavernae]